MKRYENFSPFIDLLNGGSLEKFAKSSGYNPSPLLTGPQVPAKVIFRDNNRYEFFFSEPTRKVGYEFASMGVQLYGGGYEGFCKYAHVIGDKESIELIKAFEKDVEAYKVFFYDTITKGYVDKDQFNAFAKLYIGNSMIFMIGSDLFHLTLGFTPSVKDTIQEYIERNFIIIPALDPSDRTFELMRICPHCQKFFLAKAAKTIFCSPSCRVMHQRRKL